MQGELSHSSFTVLGQASCPSSSKKLKAFERKKKSHIKVVHMALYTLQ